MAKNTLDQRMTDNRVVQYHIRRGTVTEAQWQAHLDSLPDDAEEALETETQFSPAYELRHYVDQPDEEAPSQQD
jgi:hypothetical protein